MLGVLNRTDSNEFQRNFKGLCREDIAVLGQFCPKVIAKCLNHTENAAFN